jgi:hypothetical protein
LSKGYSGDVAYLISLFFYKSSKGAGYFLSGFNGGHHTLTGEMQWGALKKFFKNGYTPDDHLKPMRTSFDTTYSIFQRIAPTERFDGESSTNVFIKALDPDYVEPVWGAAPKVYTEEQMFKLADFITQELKG